VTRRTRKSIDVDMQVFITKERFRMQSIKMMIVFICALPFLAGCGAGLSAFNKAQKLERQGNLDDAVMKYAEAAAANPDVAEYRVRFLKTSEEAAKVHLKKGEEYLGGNRYDDALREFQTAFALDPSYERAAQLSERTVKLRNSLIFFKEGEEFEKNRKLREAFRSYQKAVEINPENSEAKEAADRLLKSRKPKLDGYELNLKSTKPITLKFKDAKIKEVFNILTQLSGINFIFDEGLKDINVSIFLENATFQQALEIITGVNKLGKKVLNESTIIVYPKTPDKNKQYDELVVETFQLNKLDAKKAVNLIRTMLQVKKIYVNEDMNALVIRDTPDAIEIARKILEANDIPDAEVVLEVEVVEISKNNAENFGLVLSKYALSAAAANSGTLLSDSLVPPTTTSVAGAAAAQTTVSANNLLDIFRWKGFNGFLTVPSATFNFAKTLANGQTLANPRLRVKNREKSKFNVGTRVPITTTSSPVGGGVSVNVQYVDVGVKVNAEPTIQLNDDVNIKLGLEVSSIISRQTVGDTTSLTTVVTIGTRNLDTVLSLKDGETSIIGGLIQDNKTNSKQKVFLLGDIPILGALFTGTNNTNDKTELVLAITPRIVRGITVPDADVARFWSGKEDDPSAVNPYLSFVQEPELLPAQPAVSAVSPLAPAPAAGAGQPVSAAPPVAAPAAAAAPAPQALPRIPLSIAAPASVKEAESFKVEIVASNVTNLYSAPFVLSYNTSILDFESATEGPFLKKDGKPTAFQASGAKGSGQITVNLSRSGNVGGMNGAGTLATLIFKAKSKGLANLGITTAYFTDPGGKPLDVIPFNTVVEVK
jgi:general secretion pathway protein D